MQLNNVDVDQFSLFVEQRTGEDMPRKRTSVVLNPGRPKGKFVDSWNWKLSGKKSTYYALFPRAWTCYEEPEPNVKLICRQVCVSGS